jgi:alpha-L-rhamnosidase
MASKKEYPGWGYMLDQGATTSWEDWQGRSSRIHDTLISLGSWFVQGIGGIRADESGPGFRHFLVKPAPVGDLTYARASYRCPYGEIISNWRLDGGSLHLDLTVPPGTTATVYLPTADAATVREGDRPAAQSRGVSAAGAEGGKARFQVVSGTYAFTCPYTR